jgi:hypothetical protein
MLFIQFIFIIIDRALYLRRYVNRKYVFQIFQVVVVHFWIVVILPDTTET